MTQRDAPSLKTLPQVCLSLLGRAFVWGLFPIPSLSPAFFRQGFRSNTQGSGGANHIKCNFNFSSLDNERHLSRAGQAGQEIRES